MGTPVFRVVRRQLRAAGVVRDERTLGPPNPGSVRHGLSPESGSASSPDDVSLHRCAMTAEQRPTRRQIVRFAAVGLVSNGVLLLLIWGLTSAGLRRRCTSCLAAGPLPGVRVVNRLADPSAIAARPARHLRATSSPTRSVTSATCSSAVARRPMGLPHQWVQAAAILCVAALVFTLQKHWVFRTPVERKAQ